MDEHMRDRIRLDSIMCVVDAEQIFAAPEMMELKLRQVAFADMLILNKVDLVAPAEIERIKAWLDDRFHRYRLVQTSHGNVPLEILLSVGRFDPSRLNGAPSHEQRDHPPDCDDPDCGRHNLHDHSQVFRTWSYETEEPLCLDVLRETARNAASGHRRKLADEPFLAVGELWLETDRPARVEVDGEPHGQTPIRVGLDANALRLMAPAGTPDR